MIWKQENNAFGLTIYLFLAAVGIIWGGSLIKIIIGITFVLMSYLFWRIHTKSSGSDSHTPRRFFAEIKRDPNDVILNIRKAINQSLKQQPRPAKKMTGIHKISDYLSAGILILMLCLIIFVFIFVGITVTGYPIWTGALPAFLIFFAIYSILSLPKRKRLTSITSFRLLIAIVTFGIPLVMWFSLGLIAALQISSGIKTWYFLAIPGILLPFAIFGIPVYTQDRVRHSYIPFPENVYTSKDEENPFREFFLKVKIWSDKIGVLRPPIMMLSPIKGMSPHIFGWRTIYLAIPASLPEIIKKIRIEWPVQADALIDFMAIHELTHIVHKDHRILIWLRSISRYYFTLFVPCSFTLSVLGCFLLKTQHMWRLLLTIAMIIPFIVALHWMAFVQILLINREREYLADQRAIEFIGPEKASLLIDKVGDKSPLQYLFSMFSNMPGPSIGEALSNDNILSWINSRKSRVRNWIVKLFHGFTYTHPTKENRDENLGRAYDVERLFVPREHGMVTGFMIASIWFTFLLIAYALDYREFKTLDFMLFWICTIILFALTIVPLRQMKGRNIIAKRIMKHIGLSYIWSIITTTLTLQTMAIIPMIMLRRWDIIVTFFNQIFLVHLAAAVIGLILTPRLEELGIIGKVTKMKSMKKGEA